MKKVNFRKARIFTDYKKSSYVIADITDDITNIIYTKLPGMPGTKSVCERISESSGSCDITKEEEEVIEYLISSTGIITDVAHDALKIILNEEVLREKIKLEEEENNPEIRIQVARAMNDILKL